MNTPLSSLLLLLWMLPFFGALVLWAFGERLGRMAGYIASALVFGSFALAFVLWFGDPAAHILLAVWAPGIALGLQIDPLSLLWTLIITGVGGLIHIYSLGYLAGDRGFGRFFAYMNFFVFAMLTLVLSDNFVGLLIGWGLVGLASYFLIGFWFERPSAVAAARKAFVINVVGDVGLLFGIFVLFTQLGTTTYADVFSRAMTIPPNTLFLACLGLFIGCAAKSAQVPLHTWLPDAMEGPTPVSALIHAATMVTAGVYLVARCAPLWNASPPAQEMVAVVGAITALLGAILGLAQWDIKRILAYSTMSQIGYMMIGVGVGSYEAGVLHFFTHAFFKAQLFLGSGLIIHAMHDEQDIRKMGGLARRMPFAFWTFVLGVCAICGIPFFSGYFSKDAIIYGALEHGHPWIYAVAVLTAGLTAYYMFRLLLVTFFGAEREHVEDRDLGIPERHPAHAEHAEAPEWFMQLPVALLMIPTVLAGFVAAGGENAPWARFFGPLFGAAPPGPNLAPIPELGSTLIVLAVVFAGIAIAYVRYGAPSVTADAVERLRAEALAMPAVLTHAFYFDDFIALAFVRPAQIIGQALMRFIDPHVIDAAVRDVVWIAGYLGAEFRAVQTGLIRSYVVTLVVGATVFIAYFSFLSWTR